MSKIVQRRTNTGTGQYWMRRLMRTAEGLAKFASWRGVKEGYLLLAKRTGKQRSATMLDLPVRIRLYGLLAGVAGNQGSSPAFPVAGNRDAFVATATLPGTTEETRDAAVFPTGVAYYVGGAPPESALQYIASNTVYAGPRPPTLEHKLGYMMFVDVAGQLAFFPRDPAASPLWLGTSYYGRSDQGTTVLFSESLVSQVTGGKVFFPLGVEISSLNAERPVTPPRCASDRLGSVVVSCLPTVAQLPGSGVRDYGELHLFFGFTEISDEGAVTQPHDVSFPAIPQFAQGTWENNGTEFLPHVYAGSVVFLPNQTAVLHGHLFQYFDAPNNASEYKVCVFRLEITRAGQELWNVVSCDVSGDDAITGSGGLRINSANGLFRVPLQPSVFYAAGDDWSVFVDNVVDPPDITEKIVGPQGRVAAATVRVVRGAAVAASGLPPGVSMGRGLPTTVTVVGLVDQISPQQPIVCCHVATDTVFGVTFFGFSEADGSLVLCKWDTIDGFAVWEGFDLSALNTPAADFLPGITCYSMAEVTGAVGQEVVAGTPAFTVSGGFGGIAKTFVITNGVAKLVTEGGGLSAALLGNPLQTTPLNDLY